MINDWGGQLWIATLDRRSAIRPPSVSGHRNFNRIANDARELC